MKIKKGVTADFVKTLLEFSPLLIGVICAIISYWWQVEQGSDDWKWNYGMALIGFVGGMCVGMFIDDAL